MNSSFSVIPPSNVPHFSFLSSGNEIVFKKVSKLALENDNVSLYK